MQLDCLMEQIEARRAELNELILEEHRTFSDHEVVNKSVELDVLLDLFHKGEYFR